MTPDDGTIWVAKAQITSKSSSTQPMYSFSSFSSDSLKIHVVCLRRDRCVCALCRDVSVMYVGVDARGRLDRGLTREPQSLVDGLGAVAVFGE